MNTQRQNERDLWDLNESIDLDTPIDFDSNGEPEMTDAELDLHERNEQERGPMQESYPGQFTPTPAQCVAAIDTLDEDIRHYETLRWLGRTECSWSEDQDIIDAMRSERTDLTFDSCPIEAN